MPQNFRKNLKFQNRPEERLDEINFIGGLVTDKHETKLEPNQSPDLANVTFNNTGSIKTRNGFSRYNTAPIGVSSDQSNTGASAGTLLIDSVNDYVAQTFVPSGDISTVQVSVYLSMETADEEQLARVELWSTSASEPDTLITDGQAQILLVSGTSETEYAFRFRRPTSESASTTYAIVIKPFVQGASQAINNIEVHYTASAYANGQVYTSTDTGASWTGDSAKDLKFNVYSGGDTGGTGLIRFYTTTGIKQTLVKIGGTLYRGNDATGAMTAITLGNGGSLSSTNDIDWVTANDTLLIVDDSSRIQKYKGSTNANYSTGTIAVTNGSATVTGTSTVWDTATNAEAGEYIKLPDGKWYEIISIASDTSLTIEVDYQGSTASGESYTISPWGEIQGNLNSSSAPADLTRPAPKHIENHLNRIWTLKDNTLSFSVLLATVDGAHINDWDTANKAGTIKIPAGQGDSGTGLFSFGGYLYIFQKSAIWEIIGSSPANFELRNISNEVGMVSRNTLVEYDRYLVFLADKGLYLFDGSNLSNLSDTRVNNLINSWANKTSCHATLWGNKYLISYTPTGGTYNTEILVYDFNRDAFGKMEGVYAAQWSNWDGGNDTGEIYFVSDNQGSIYKWDDGSHDDGYEIATRYSTGSLALSTNTNQKTVKKVYIQQLALGDWTMEATQFTDISDTETSSEISLSAGDSVLWDDAEWDVASWPSEGTLITTRIAEFQGIAHYYKYIFEQIGYAEGMEILALTVTARERRLR